MTENTQRRGWRLLATCVSLIALAGTITPAVLFLVDRMDLATVHSAMLWATVAWFASAALWISADLAPQFTRVYKRTECWCSAFGLEAVESVSIPL